MNNALTAEQQARVTAFVAGLQALSQRYGVDVMAEVKRRRIKVDDENGREQVREESWVEIGYVLDPNWQPPKDDPATT